MEQNELTPEQLKAKEIEAKRLLRNMHEFSQTLQSMVNLIAITAIYIDDFKKLEYHNDIEKLKDKKNKKQRSSLKEDAIVLYSAMNTFFRHLREKSPNSFKDIREELVGSKIHDLNTIIDKITVMTPLQLSNIVNDMEEIQAGRVRIETVQIAQDEPTN